MKLLGAVILFYVLVGICTYVFKKRTPEEYAASAARHPTWLFARWTALWKTMGGLGLDPEKVAEGAFQLITGRVAPLAIGIVAAPRKPSDPPPAGGAAARPPVDPLDLLPVIQVDDEPPSTKPETPAARRMPRLVLVHSAILTVIAIVLVVACAQPAASPSTEQQRVDRAKKAELEYGAALQLCVVNAKLRMTDQSDTSKRKALADADECAHVVRSAWSDDGGAPVRDAGDGEGGAS